MLPARGITDEERARRRDIWEQALASVRLEGLEPDDDVHVIWDRFMDGELTLEQVGKEIDILHDRKYGPIRLSRD